MKSLKPCISSFGAVNCTKFRCLMAPKLYSAPKRPLCHLFLFITLIPSCPNLENTQQLPIEKLTVPGRPESPSHSHPITANQTGHKCFYTGWIGKFDCGQVCT